MKIVQLSSENILRLTAVTITPDGNLIIIGGKNGQGKTSAIDSIVLAIGGKKAKHQEPLKRGKKKGRIKVKVETPEKYHIGDFTVLRTYTQKGSNLKVTNDADGKEYSSPQTLLDGFTGELTFDPLEFAKANNKVQLETLKNLVGLDFTKLDEERAEHYSNRTDWNKAVTRLKVAVESMEDRDVPLVEISVSDLTLELEAAIGVKTKLGEYRREMKTLKEQHLSNTETIGGLERQIEKLKEDQVKIQIKAKAIKSQITEIDVEDIDGGIEKIRKQISSAEETNTQIRENITLNKSAKELEEAEQMSGSLTDKINKIDEVKVEQLELAAFPIDGLSFDDTGVLFNDIPFSQASSAERLRTSIAMGIALNPDLRVLLIRDGSLLDEDNLKTVAKMADEADCQVWLERVGKGEECSVIIEDGRTEAVTDES